MNIHSEIVEAVKKRQTLGQPAPGEGTLHVGFGFDAAYALPMAVSLTSIVVNSPATKIYARLFSSSFDDGDLLKLEALVKRYPNLGISLYEVSNTIVNTLPVRRDVPLAMYFRIMMPVVLTELDKILYLDCDVLCLGDISGIARIDMEGKMALVVSDVNRTAEKRIGALALKSGKYFNSGVMMIDIKKWNEDKISEQFFSLISKSSYKFSFVDQDQLNIILENKTKYIDKKWNFIPSDSNIPFELFSDVKLLHCTRRKPWKIHYSSQAHPLFLQYQNLSPWSGTSLEYPKTYREARKYSKLLFKKGLFKESFVWFIKYLTMRFSAKVHRT